MSCMSSVNQLGRPNGLCKHGPGFKGHFASRLQLLSHGLVIALVHCVCYMTCTVLYSAMYMYSIVRGNACEMTEVKGESTRRFWMPVSGVIHEPQSMTSDVQARRVMWERFSWLIWRRITAI